jgi:Xaa-Pro aminopeptidase
MTDSIFYNRRLKLLKKTGGAILLLGNSEIPRNFSGYTYPFRQDSNFLYYTGISMPDLVLLITPDGKTALYGQPPSEESIIWNGKKPSLKTVAKAAQIEIVKNITTLKYDIQRLIKKGVCIHHLLPYTLFQRYKLSELFNFEQKNANSGASVKLTKEVIRQRSVKSKEEIASIEKALDISCKMYTAALKAIKPGRYESEITAVMQKIAIVHNMPLSFLPIVTVKGQILHNNSYSNRLKKGQLLLIDSGVEAPPLYYASDTTRTFPVSGKFTSRQKDIYAIVLAAQKAAIKIASSKVSNRDLHIEAAKTITSGLKSLKIIKGNPEEAAEQGAHRLFFPHGIGHMLGLDVHDMEDLTKSLPSGKEESPLKEQYGLNKLRLRSKLKKGFVITVEPGIYFIPSLIKKWKKINKLAQFINYNEIEKFIDFGGIRIEDDIIITNKGCRVLGPEITKEADHIEKLMSDFSD